MCQQDWCFCDKGSQKKLTFYFETTPAGLFLTSILVDIQLSSVSRLNANVVVGEPVKITLLEDAIHEASQITLTAMHTIPFVSNVMFSLFTKEIMRMFSLLSNDMLGRRTSLRQGLYTGLTKKISSFYLHE
jgi:hypothetical protein